MKIKISIPNDYNSNHDEEAAILDCYDGDQDAALNDGFRACYDALASAANDAGLEFVCETDFGAEWEGTEAQCEKAREILPSWAYISMIAQTIREWMEEQGNSTDESSRLPQGNMDEEVIEIFTLSDGSKLAFTDTSYVLSHSAGHDAGEAEAFNQEQPAWAKEVRTPRA